MSTSFSRHHGLASLSDYGIAARYQTHNKDAYDSVLIQKILEDLALLERVRDRLNHYSLK